MHESLNAITGDYAIAGFNVATYGLTQSLMPSAGGTLTVTESGTSWLQTNGYGSGLTGLGTTTVTGSDQYTLVETGTDSGNNSVSISVAGLESAQTVTTVNARTDTQSITTSGLDQYTRTLNGSTDSGTLVWSSSDGGASGVGNLSYSPSGNNRYNLIESFVPAATDVSNTSEGNVTFNPAGSPYGVTDPGVGGGVGGAFGGLRDVSGANGVPASGVLDHAGQLGKVWGSAAQAAEFNDSGADLLAYAPVLGAEVFQKYCFAAGTPLLTPDGHKLIEEFRAGDLVLSRDEWDISGAVEVKVVEEVFTGTSAVVDVHVSGEVIRTTAEHKFWVRGRGWTSVGDFEPGCELVGHDGQRTRVERITPVDGLVAVYNLRIADHHTYFVGTEEWGFSAWSHNMYDLPADERADMLDAAKAEAEGRESPEFADSPPAETPTPASAPESAPAGEPPAPPAGNETPPVQTPQCTKPKAFPELTRGGEQVDAEAKKVVQAMTPEARAQAARRMAEQAYDASTKKNAERKRDPEERAKYEKERAEKREAAVEKATRSNRGQQRVDPNKSVTVILHEDGTVSIGISGSVAGAQQARQIAAEMNSAQRAEGKPEIYGAAKGEIDPEAEGMVDGGTAENPAPEPGACSEAGSAVTSGENKSEPKSFQTVWGGGDATFPNEHRIPGNPRAGGDDGPLLMDPCATCQANGDIYTRISKRGSSGGTA